MSLALLLESLTALLILVLGVLVLPWPHDAHVTAAVKRRRSRWFCGWIALVVAAYLAVVTLTYL